MKEQHKIFADKYIEILDGTESYLFAYPKCKNRDTARVNASKLLTNPNIKEYIKERLESKDKERIASQDEVLERLTEIMRGNVKDQLGLETPVKEMVKAAELLGKRYKIFTEKQEIESKNENLNTDMTNLSLDERRKRIDELIRKRGTGTT